MSTVFRSRNSGHVRPKGQAAREAIITVLREADAPACCTQIEERLQFGHQTFLSTAAIAAHLAVMKKASQIKFINLYTGQFVRVMGQEFRPKNRHWYLPGQFTREEITQIVMKNRERVFTQYKPLRFRKLRNAHTDDMRQMVEDLK